MVPIVLSESEAIAIYRQEPIPGDVARDTQHARDEEEHRRQDEKSD